MSRLTYKHPNGTWGLMNGYNIQKVPNELYGALWKLKDYEDTGLNPDEIEHLNEAFNSLNLQIIKFLGEFNLQIIKFSEEFLEMCKENEILKVEIERLEQLI